MLRLLLASHQIFTVELSLNMFAYWFRTFFTNGWHVFDFVVVTSAITPPIRREASRATEDPAAQTLRLTL